MITQNHEDNESQYELLNIIPQTSSQRSNSYDGASDTSCLESAERPPSALSNHSSDDVQNTESSEPLTGLRKQRLPRQYFCPTALKRFSLISFLVLLVLLVGVLSLLYSLSMINHGIDDFHPTLFYVWTYGPTAVFTVIAVYWNQVEFRILQLYPWSLISHDPVSAADSILVNYCGIWNVLAMFQAVKRRHVQVALAVIGSLLISGLVVVSTALFIRQAAILNYPATFQFASTISPSTNTNLQIVNGIPYIQAYLTMTQNTTSPLGTNDDLIYDVFFDGLLNSNVSATYLHNASYTANINTLTSRMECEPATVKKNPDYNSSTASETVLIDSLMMESPSCTNTSAGQLLSYVVQGGDFALWATMGCCSCDRNDTALMSMLYADLDMAKDWRLFVYASHFHTPQKSLSIPTPENSDFISYICIPKVDMKKGAVTLARVSTTDQVLSNIVLGSDTIIPGVNVSTPRQLLHQAYISFRYFVGTPQAVNFLLNPSDDSNISKFFDAESLKQYIEHTIPRIMTQSGNAYLMANSTASMNGRITKVQDRIVLRTMPFALTMAGLVLLSLVTGFFCTIKTMRSCPRDPSSLASNAAILAKSPQLKELLQSSGSSTEEMLKKHLSHTKIRREESPETFSVVSIGGTTNEVTKDQITWWSPTSSRSAMRVLIIGSPLAVIILLETCFQFSKRNGRLAEVTVEGLKHYALLYVPPLLLLGVRVLLGMIDTSGRLFQPFSVLSRGNAGVKSSLLEYLPGKWTPIAFIRAFRMRYWAVVASTFAVFFAPFLSIIVASLFLRVPALTFTNITIQQTERWNFSDPTGSLYYAPLWYPGIESRSSSTGISMYLGPDGVIPSMILNQNLSFPKFTTSQFSLSTFEVTREFSDYLGNATIQARVPGVRVNLSCKEALGNKVSFWAIPERELTNITYGVSGLGNGNDNCGYASNFTISGAVSFEVGSPHYYGEATDTRLSALNLTDRPDCPTRLFFLSDKNNLSVKTLACRPRLEQIEADVTFNYPDFSFSAESPPKIVSDPVVLYDGFFNTSHKVALSDQSVLNFYSGIQPNNSAGMGDVFPSINQVEKSLMGGYGVNQFEQIEYSFGVTLEAMFEDTNLMSEQLQQLYGIMVNQVLRSFGIEKGVAPRGNDPGQGPIKAVRFSRDEKEDVIQNEVVTRVLEAILALMTICMAASISLQRTRRILPKDPEGIVATMSLLAGASPRFWKLFENLDGPEWMSDQEMEKEGVFDGVRFRMGWSGSSSPNQSKSGSYQSVPMREEDTGDTNKGRWCIDIDQGPDS